ncbi:hypothetical protein KL86PLE_30013 [uncultured Pleomorphomonas sp.]|uniref:Uncharacterized protein n=1 Tax=uncultured Pleomorphomonas sp. TaxID=442121 RepID=A0A212LDC1_9HYPH|nr:hypothetical protein [uncultured Pleomorphomonas sp.]SCM75566.1 hypothetical protein KL86PLE_30013 [uncultured Pleomorphomonas sp.]
MAPLVAGSVALALANRAAGLNHCMNKGSGTSTVAFKRFERLANSLSPESHSEPESGGFRGAFESASQPPESSCELADSLWEGAGAGLPDLVGQEVRGIAVEKRRGDVRSR